MTNCCIVMQAMQIAPKTSVLGGAFFAYGNVNTVAEANINWQRFYLKRRYCCGWLNIIARVFFTEQPLRIWW
ncbi:unnamed protein product [Urochloa humidicola]